MSRELRLSDVPPGEPLNAEVGDIVVKRDGSRWHVDCMSDDGHTLGLSPVGLWHRLYWWARLRLPVGWSE